jgi:hypothetical protein
MRRESRSRPSELKSLSNHLSWPARNRAIGDRQSGVLSADTLTPSLTGINAAAPYLSSLFAFS